MIHYSKILPNSIILYSLIFAYLVMISYTTNFGMTEAFAQLNDNWKTIISPKYNFSMDYPSQLIVQNGLYSSELPTVSFIYGDPKDTGINLVYLTIFPNNTSFFKAMDKRFNSTFARQNYQLYEKPVNIKINNITGVSFSYLAYDSTHEEFFFTHGNNIYGLDVVGSTDAYSNTQFNRMAKSIKFFD
jgi:hypothetical protein